MRRPSSPAGTIYHNFSVFRNYFPKVWHGKRLSGGLSVYRPHGCFTGEEMYAVLLTLGKNPEDVVRLQRYRRIRPDGTRPQRLVALYSFELTADGFWVIPYLDVDGTWQSVQIYPLVPFFDHTLDILVSEGTTKKWRR